MTKKVLFTTLLILWGNVVSYIALLFLGWLSDDVSFVLACIVGVAFLFAVPGFVIFSAHSLLEQSIIPKTAAPTVLILCILFILSAPGTVPYLKVQSFCQSTFETAAEDYKSCDFMCFDTLEVMPSKAISYSYTHSHRGVKTSRKKHYVPIVDEQKKIRLWVEGKAGDHFSGKCIQIGGRYDAERHLKKYQTGTPIYGKMVISPYASIGRYRRNIRIFFIILDGLALLLWMWFSMKPQRKRKKKRQKKSDG